MTWQTRRVGRDYDLLAPDGSEIRLLAQVRGGSMVHCTLPPGAITHAVRHRTVEELWLVLAGQGQLWRRSRASGADEIVDLEPGIAVTVPLSSDFQFRALGDGPLELVITTIPPWPGSDEAIAVEGAWQATR